MWSIVALVATIVVGGIMLGSAALYGSRAFTGGALETAITQSADIAQSIKGVYGGTANSAVNFISVTNSEAIKAGAIPTNMTNGDGQTITGPWNNPITLSASTDGNAFLVDENRVPSSACAKLAVSQKVDHVRVNGTWVSPESSNFASQVAQNCNQGAGSFSDVTFSFVMNYD